MSVQRPRGVYVVVVVGWLYEKLQLNWEGLGWSRKRGP